VRDPKSSMHLYEIVEFIGRWSMIDVFVVAILSALVQLGFAAQIAPGPAAACFALSVAFTMLSAQAFDPRLLWDAARTDGNE
ncbi:MAG: paraquat-inducible protein A, partial [Pseudomonadota bacterium]